MNYYASVILAYFVIDELSFTISLENNTECTECEIKSPSTDVDYQWSQSAESAFLRRKWISQLFLEARQKFQMGSDVSIECKKDFELFRSHLKNQSAWAIKMTESSEWPVDGILSSAVNYMGKYDECLTISSNGINGKYCLVEAILYDSHTLQNEIVEIPNGLIFSGEAITMYQENPARVDGNKLTFAICMPSSCQPNDLEVSLIETLNPIFVTRGLQMSVNVSPLYCEVNEELEFSQGSYIVWWLLIALFSLSVWFTLYDTSTYYGKYK